MPLPYKRADRVGDLVRRELSRLLLREVKDPRVRNLTITSVEMSADLRHAQVRFTGPAGEGLQGLRSAAGFLRGELGRALRLRHAPDLSFEVDDSVEWSLHVAALLRQIASEERGE